MRAAVGTVTSQFERGFIFVRILLILFAFPPSSENTPQNFSSPGTDSFTRVQNIVNELPLSKEIDNFLIDELKEADYFCEISNAKVSVEWLEDENGKKREELVKESVPGEEKFWGVFSLEGGKANLQPRYYFR